MDSVDEAIIELLVRDGRMPLNEIARRVNLSAAPVARRISRLERDGLIKGYTAVVDRRRMGALEAFVEIRLRGGVMSDELAELTRTLPEVEQVHVIAGDPDALIRMRVRDVGDLQRVVNELRRTGKVAGTKTLIVLDSWDRSSGGAPAG